MIKREQIEKKVFAYIRKYHMLEAGDRVVAGISGGADSVCLLFVLLEWAKQCPLELAVVHVNHGIRKEAAEDASYVKALCSSLCIPFYLTEADVRRKAEEQKCSEEEAGRRVRYQAFAEAAEQFRANKTAVAHNSNDLSETMLFHLFRGSGIKGLAGIQPVREQIIRPILCLEREEIEEYLRIRQLDFCHDATNDTDLYTRNRIRHNILPYAREYISEGCVQHMMQTAEMLSEAEEFLVQETEAKRKQLVQETGEYRRISTAGFSDCPKVLQKRLLFLLLKELSPMHRDISYVHIEKLLELFFVPGNRRISLPFGIEARREYENVIIEAGGSKRQDKMEEDGRVGAGAVCVQLDLGKKPPGWSRVIPLDAQSKLELKIIETFDIKSKEVEQNQYTKWFDCDKIIGCVTVRTRRTGDYFTISDGKGGTVHKSLKDYMITEKLPRDIRDNIVLLAEEKHVLWLMGYRISQHYKINWNTKRILQVQLVRKDFT